MVTDVTGPNASSSAASGTVSIDEQPASVRMTNYMPGSLPATGSELGAGLAAAVVLLLVGSASMLLVRLRRKPIPRA